ncbi:putative uncharacterized protein C19orf35, partial [Eschrichtius robustus]|nr:putative uncharacterized protein C19orf35 [Eschrichtius robustus]
MSNPEPPTETPGANAPTWPTQPTYSNLGEVRARLLPSKFCCSRTSERPATDPQPLPKKTLTRAQSLPTHKSPSPGPTRAGQPQKPLLGSRSVDESQAGDDRAGTACPPAELPFFSLDTELGLSLRRAGGPAAGGPPRRGRRPRWPRHFNLQELCGLAPEGALPKTPWSRPVALAAEVPELTVVQWLVETGAQPPEEFARPSELRGHGAPLGSWLRMHHALLVLHLAERAMGGEVPSLEDWLCCEYLAKATEDSLYLALELLWN